LGKDKRPLTAMGFLTVGGIFMNTSTTLSTTGSTS